MTETAVRGAMPAAATTSAPTTEAAVLDAAVATVAGHRDAWAATGPAARAALLDRMIADTLRVADRWVDAACVAKRLRPGSPEAGEEWAAGPALVIRNLRLLRDSLRDIAATGRPRIPGRVTTRADGQVVAQVFPTSAYEKLFFRGMTGEVWMEPGVTAAELAGTQAVAYRHGAPVPRVCVVLGAGNAASLGPRDALSKLFVDNCVVVLKTNPVNAYLRPFIEDAFAAVVEAGVLRIVDGGGAEGAHLCNHNDVDEIHITGSDKTHDAIVFGSGQEGARRKQAGTPLLHKRLTSELGNVSPVIVVPGPWSDRDIAYQAENIATMLANNAGFNCLAVRVIVTQRGWEGRSSLLAAIRGVLARVRPRYAYYPGAESRFATFMAAHPEAHRLGAEAEGRLPWTLIEGVDPDATDDIAFSTESFCSVCAESALDVASVPEYIDRAVGFCNERLWGTLSATMLVHPTSLRDPAVAAAVERAVAGLRYGSVCVNQWHALNFLMTSTTWGAFPGHELGDIQSGRGLVGNTCMFDRPQKSVVRSPFRISPKPSWFITNRQQHELHRRLARFEAGPTFGQLPAMLWAALRG